MPYSSIKLFLAFGLRMSMALNLFSQQGREDILGSLGWFKRSSLSYPCLSKGEPREEKRIAGFWRSLV